MVNGSSIPNSQLLAQLLADLEMSEDLRRKVQADPLLTAADPCLNEAQMLARLAQLLSEGETQKPEGRPT